MSFTRFFMPTKKAGRSRLCMSRAASKNRPTWLWRGYIHYTDVVQDFMLPSGPIQLRCTAIFLGNPSFYTYTSIHIYTHLFIYIYEIYVHTPKHIYNILWNCFSFHFALFFLLSHITTIRFLFVFIYLCIYLFTSCVP